ncbi:MAG: hypothetical protein J6I70_06245 [Bacteroidaceae bacterium]|nr:hypothetical protein [Bacteroidaceae bacterium]
MLEAIMVMGVISIITYGTYKLFELFVCRKERMSIIEKMGDKFSPDMLENKISFSSVNTSSFTALKFGCLFIGLGLGLLVGYFICTGTLNGYTDIHTDKWQYKELVSIIYGACIFLFGGIGLISAFLIELRLKKDKQQ